MTDRRPSESGSQAAPDRRLLTLLWPDLAPVEMQLLGRALLHAALVGLACGLVGAGFFAGLEHLQHLLLEQLAGYVPLRARGEEILPTSSPPTFRPWLLVVLPALGALAGGLISRLAPETRGGGGDAVIDAFHHHGGVIRRRVAWVKGAASICTLGAGGSGGREGPTMQIGGALGSLAGRLLNVSARERRLLMVAGVAAGISAVFRTPLGAAILAIEVLYRDDFEAEALIPAVLASVVAYSVVISIFGESTLFGRAPHYPFSPSHLPLYAVLALLVSIAATSFVGALRVVRSAARRLPMPEWARPAVGGLLLGALASGLMLYFGDLLGTPGQGLGILGGGYGAAQMSITGSAWLPEGWDGVQLLLILAAAKLIASALTIGTGGSAGDFAPSLVLGGLIGGAFGRAAQIFFPEAGIDPGAFALVGMGTFYGGIAHVPLAALVLVSEMAGSYDLLVPMMLAEGIALLLLRKRTLYPAQVPTVSDSPVHRTPARPDVLADLRVADILVRERPFVTFGPKTPILEIFSRLPEASWQDAFPVVDESGALRGLISSDSLRLVASRRNNDVSVASQIMQPPITLRETMSLRAAADLMLANSLRELPVVDEAGRIVGFLDEADISRAYLQATAPMRAGSTGSFPT